MKPAKQTHLQRLIEVSTPGQILCLMLTIVLIGYSGVLMKSINTYTRYRKLERPDYPTPEIEDFWMIIPC